ncbi:hypothetical protein [uncultured Algibacter sp.]|uniref:hypothetical protein n=1 Tax=uncultured Algibacter sp. TaxID=298659 RepID=UPI003216919F
MENNVQNIELINNYLNKTLSEEVLKVFENRLKTDEVFKTQFDEHVILIEGIKRQTLKIEIKKAKQFYTKNKWLKYFGFGALILLIIWVCFNLFSSKQNGLGDTLNFESDFIQNYQVAVDSIVEIVGVKGTLVRFNPKDLEMLSGATFSGDSLSVEVIELTTKQELLFANAQTVSHGKWLISGGVFKIDIKSNGKSLLLKDGKTIDVKFPKKTDEKEMQLFYGERNNLNRMNWTESKIKFLDEEKYYTIFYRDTSVIDKILTKRYGVDCFKEVILIDSLGYLTLNDIKAKYPEIKSFENQKDTLRILKRFVYEEIHEDYIEDDVGLRKTDSTRIELVKREDFNKVWQWSENIDDLDVISEKVAETYVNYTNQFYKSVKISKLGWINIDKYSKEDNMSNVKFNFNIKTDYDEVFLIDERNNTILNVYDKEFNIPKNRSFYIIAIGIKGKEMYGYKKSVRFNANQKFRIDYKKITETQIKSILTITL